jgi:uncharacterized protein (TIGR00369 family)
VTSRWEAIASGAVRVPLNDHLGFVVDPDPGPDGTVTMSWTVTPEYCNSAGNLQGGILAALLDAVLGGATAVNLEADIYPALAEMKISFFHPAPAGTKLTATGRVLKKGKRVHFAEAEVHDSDGKLIGKASATEIPVPA